MSFNEQLPKWDNVGNEPPESKKTEGWKSTEKPPAQWFNWLFNRIYKVLEEIRNKFTTHKGDNVAHGTATKSEAQTGTSHGSYMTPLRSKEAIQALESVSSVAGKKGVVTVTKSDVGLGNVDNVKQATKVELDEHKADKANPHGTTKTHLSLGSVLNYGIATQAEAQAGTSNVKYVTPLRAKEAIDANRAIVESGSNDDGSYRKFSDGTMECWHTYKKSVNADTATSGTWGFPHPFATGVIPTLSISFGTSSTTVVNPASMTGGFLASTTTRYSVRWATKNHDMQEREISAYLSAKGRWK